MSSAVTAYGKCRPTIQFVDDGNARGGLSSCS
jgi:hypothetical protein